MTVKVSSCAAAPPLPLSGGGAGAPVQQSPVQQSPVQQSPVQQSPVQAPLQSSAVQGAAGGGAAVQQQATPVPAPIQQAPIQQAPIQQAPISGGGGAADLSAVLPALQQVVSALTAVVGALNTQLGAGQAEAGVAGVSGGGDTAAASGCGCSCAMASGGGAAVQQKAPPVPPTPPSTDAPEPPKPAASAANKLDSADLTVKGKKMDDKQRANLQAVLEVGKEMGANDKVMKAAIATVIQESVAKNDSSVDSKDHDSLGLFQQRPSQGWGTREQISDPKYAAKKFFERAIPNDKKSPDLAMTRLAQSVQISAFPDAYAQWEGEATKILADFKG